MNRIINSNYNALFGNKLKFPLFTSKEAVFELGIFISIKREKKTKVKNSKYCIILELGKKKGRIFVLSVHDAKLDMILKMEIAECVIDKVSMIRKIISLK